MINTKVTEDIKELLDVWPMGWTFDLPPESTVVVAGSYKGRVLDLIDQVYSPSGIYGFEPQKWAFDIANERTKDLSNIYNHNYAIGAKSGVFPMGEWETDACSFVNHVREQGSGVMREIDTFFPSTFQVDLAIFNMEGYEFDLLPYMIEKGMMNHWKRFAVQFHHGFGNDSKWTDLFEKMTETHEIVIDNYPQWVYWRHYGAGSK